MIAERASGTTGSAAERSFAAERVQRNAQSAAKTVGTGGVEVGTQEARTWM
jgi:hypothetical protein